MAIFDLWSDLETTLNGVTASFKLGPGSDNNFRAWDGLRPRHVHFRLRAGLRQRFSSLGQPQRTIFELWMASDHVTAICKLGMASDNNF